MQRHARAILPGLVACMAGLTWGSSVRADSGWEDAPAAEDEPAADAPASADETAPETTPEPTSTPPAPPVSSVSSSAPKVEGCATAPSPEPSHTTQENVPPVGASLELDYGRIVLPVGGTTFSSSGWPDKKGRELGFANPLAHAVAFRSSFIVEPHLGVTFGMNFAWAHADATGTDPVAQQTTGWLFASDFLDLGVEGVETLGPFTFRAGGSLGPRILMIGMDHKVNNSNAVGSFQFYVRPRVAAELALGDSVSLGAYVSDDILRTTSVGVGAYLGFRTDGFEQH
jgi:hypothetical protein